LLRTRPTLRRPQHDHRPARTPRDALRPRIRLDAPDVGDDGVERRSERLMDLLGLVALDKARRVAVALEEALELTPRDAGGIAGIHDLVAVQVQDRENRAVACGIQELVRVPAGREGAGLGLAVADDARDDQVRVVEGGAVRVRQRVAELTALVDRARS